MLLWVQKLRDRYADYPEDEQLLTELTVTGKEQKNGYELIDGVIRYTGRVWVGSNVLAHQHILHAMHDNSIGG